MKTRIKLARTEKHLSQKALADKIGISDAALSKIESGVNNPARSTLLAIANALNISLEWLETGVGEMKLETTNQTLDRISRRYSQSHTFRMMLDVYAQMDEEGQAAVERYVELLAEAVAQGKDPVEVYPTQDDASKNAASRVEECRTKGRKHRQIRVNDETVNQIKREILAPGFASILM